jgi:hypothetical protein
VTNSRIKLSKIFGLFSPASGQEKTQSDADAKFCAFTALVHCRDKIEFNLKSQKLEEPVFAVSAANPRCGGMETLAACVWQSTGILNFLQLSR